MPETASEGANIWSHRAVGQYYSPALFAMSCHVAVKWKLVKNCAIAGFSDGKKWNLLKRNGS